MKDIKYLGIVFIIFLSLTGCGKKEVVKEELKQEKETKPEVSCLYKVNNGDFSCYTGEYEKISGEDPDLINFTGIIDNEYFTTKFKKDSMCKNGTYAIDSKCPNDEYSYEEIDNMICVKKGYDLDQNNHYFWGTFCIIPAGVEYKHYYNYDTGDLLENPELVQTDTSITRLIHEGGAVAGETIVYHKKN